MSLDIRGRGAEIGGEFNLIGGDVLEIAVGGAGIAGNGGGSGEVLSLDPTTRR